MACRFSLIAAVALTCLIAIPAQAQINYIQAQQAGKVWGDKISENNRREMARRAAAGDHPITPAERRAGLVRHRAEYDRLVRSVGTRDADRALDLMIRRDLREQRTPASSAHTGTKVACSHKSRPAAEQKRLEAEFDTRVRRDGLASAGAWAREQGRLLRARHEAQGIC